MHPPVNTSHLTKASCVPWQRLEHAMPCHAMPCRYLAHREQKAKEHKTRRETRRDWVTNDVMGHGTPQTRQMLLQHDRQMLDPQSRASSGQCWQTSIPVPQSQVLVPPAPHPPAQPPHVARPRHNQPTNRRLKPRHSRRKQRTRRTRRPGGRRRSGGRRRKISGERR